MPLRQDLNEFCVDLKLGPGAFCLTLPGGAELCVQADPGSPDAASAAKKLFETVNGALTPLVPVFNIIDTVIALKDCLEAVPKVVGPPPDPTPLLECLPDLVRKVDALLALLPQASLPILAAQIIDSLIAFLRAYKARVQFMYARLEAIVRAETRAAQAGNVQLQLLLDCARGNLETDLVNMNASFTPLQRLVGLVNAFLDLAGLPCLPDVTGISELSEIAIEDIELLISLLESIRALIPVPDFDSGARSSFSKTCDTQLQ